MQLHPARPMLSSAEPDTRDLLAAMGRGWCWVSKALLPTTASTHLRVRPNPELRGFLMVSVDLDQAVLANPGLLVNLLYAFHT